jgi:heme oxygenase
MNTKENWREDLAKLLDDYGSENFTILNGFVKGAITREERNTLLAKQDFKMHDFISNLLQSQEREIIEKIIEKIKSSLDNSEGYYDAVFAVLDETIKKIKGEDESR